MALKFSLARVGACALALLAMSTVSPVSASAQAPPYFMQWGSPSGSGNGMLYGPRGVALDASGDVYIADCDNNRIQKFTASGTYIMQWGSEGGGNGQFNFPCAIAVDTSGDIYIADGNNHRIQKFTSDGTYITQWGVAFPYGVTVDKDGNVYVVDLGSHRVQKFTNGGALLTQWGSFGSGNGQFEWPLGVAVDASGDVYVTDESDRVQKFTGDGTYIIGWGAPGAGNGQLGLPYGVALDASGNVYVAEYDNNRIQKFTGNGGYLTQWGGLGSGNGQFSAPSGVAVDAGSDVYVADIRNSRIQVFSYGPYITGITDVPNDQGGSVRVTWAAGLPESGGRAGIDAYRVRRRESGSWVSVGSVLRSGSPTYSCVVPTTSDYTVGAPLPWNVFRIDAEAPDTGYVSPPDRGYSIDDLAPAPPTGFVGTFASGVATMHWHAAPEPDFSFYALYRGPTPGFVPTPARLVATTSDTTYVDNLGSAFCYELLSTDIHGNAGSPALYIPDPPLAVPGNSTPSFELDELRPNPLSSSALTVGFTLSGSETASLELLDTAGRLVSKRDVGGLGAGTHALDLADSRRLSAGLYFVRLRQGPSIRIARVVVLK